MSLRLVKCHRCDHEWATKVKPKRCAKCRTPYWRKSREGELRIEEEYRHAGLTMQEWAAIWRADGGRPTWMSESAWLALMPEGDREKWAAALERP